MVDQTTDSAAERWLALLTLRVSSLHINGVLTSREIGVFLRLSCASFGPLDGGMRQTITRMNMSLGSTRRMFSMTTPTSSPLGEKERNIVRTCIQTRDSSRGRCSESVAILLLPLFFSHVSQVRSRNISFIFADRQSTSCELGRWQQQSANTF